MKSYQRDNSFGMSHTRFLIFVGRPMHFKNVHQFPSVDLSKFVKNSINRRMDVNFSDGSLMKLTVLNNTTHRLVYSITLFFTVIACILCIIIGFMDEQYLHTLDTC